MVNREIQKRLTDLSAEAQASLTNLLQLEEVTGEQWFMRRAAGARPCPWEPLTKDSAENDRLIKERIAASEATVTGLVLAFIGLVEWRKKRQLMAYLQCFRAGYPQGILCLRHLREISPGGKFEAYGSFLIVGACQNIWI
jgi:hypothetical protein